MIFQALVIVPIVLVLLHWLFHVITKPRHLPPGPFPLPIIGNIHIFFNRRPQDIFRDLQRKYGPVTTIHIGHSKRLIVFLEADVIFDVFTSRETAEIVADREEISALNSGIVFAGWPEASEPRRFALRCLKEFGLSQSATALAKKGAHIHDEIAAFCSYVESVTNQPVDITERLRECLSSCVMIPLYGNRLDFTDEKTKKLYVAGSKFFDATTGQIMIGQLLGSISPIFQSGFIKGLIEMTNVFREWAVVEIEKRKSTFRPDQPLSDFVDFYMASEYKATGSTEKMSLESFSHLLSDMFLGGMETTGQVSKWMLFYLAHFPEWQEKIQAEIDSLVGNATVPSLEHKSKLVHLQAFTHEVFRHSSFMVFTLNKYTLRELKFNAGGRTFKIPEATPVMYATCLANEDNAYWGDPEKFRPERWLTEDNPPAVKNEIRYMLFGIGKRACVGESAARSLVYLVISALLQRFSFRLATPVPLSADDQRANRNPPSFELIINPRS